MIATILGLGGYLLAVLFGLEAYLTRRRLRIERLRVAALEQSLADEITAKETAVRLLDEIRTARGAEFDEFRAQVNALRSAYGDALEKYRIWISALEETVASPRLH